MTSIFVVINSFLLWMSIVLVIVVALLYRSTRMVRRAGGEHFPGARLLPSALIIGLVLFVLSFLALALANTFLLSVGMTFAISAIFLLLVILVFRAGMWF